MASQPRTSQKGAPARTAVAKVLWAQLPWTAKMPSWAHNSNPVSSNRGERLVALGEELFDKACDSMKEIALYTPSGAAFLGSTTSFLPAEAVHLSLILMTPLIVLAIKGHHEHMKAHPESPSRRKAKREGVIADETFVE